MMVAQISKNTPHASSTREYQGSIAEPERHGLLIGRVLQRPMTADTSLRRSRLARSLDQLGGGTAIRVMLLIGPFVIEIFRCLHQSEVVGDCLQLVRRRTRVREGVIRLRAIDA